MLKLIIFVVAIYCLMAGYLYLMQRDMMYFPTRENNHVNAEALWLETKQARLKVWRINDHNKASILYFGGNAEAVEYNIPDFKKIFADHTVYLVNYRGYGGSTGSPTESGLLQDALAIYDWISPSHTSVNVIGRSLGSAVAIHLAANRAINKLALITPFDSLKNVAQSHYPLFPVKWFMKDGYDVTDQASQLKNHSLMLLAEHDRIIPAKRSQALIDIMSNARIEIHNIQQAGHNNISFSGEMNRRLDKFIHSK